MSTTLDARGNVVAWFATAILETAEAYGAKLTEARVRIYANDLGDLPPPQVIAALRRCRRDGSGFFPSVAEVRRQCVATPDDRALLAWTAMEQAAARIGAYQSVEFEDTVAAQALLQVFGSWPHWCEQEQGPELHAKRLQFLAAYREIRRQQADGSAAEPVRLSGLLEAGGKYQRQPQLASGRVTEHGAVLTITEATQARLNGESNRQRRLPPKE